MQSRERILLLIVVGLLVLVAGLWGGKRAVDTLRSRQSELQRLDSEADQTSVLEAQLTELTDRRTRLAERSLPPDTQTAKLAYHAWLADLVQEQGFLGVKVEQQRTTADKGFTRLGFQVSGEATYQQLIRFLEKFYAADHLHKITSLKMPLGRGPELLNISISIEALSLPKSQNKQELSKHASLDNPPERLQAAVNQLMLRHFYRSNQAPQITVAASVPATVGRSIRVDLTSKDPDGDKVSYKLDSGPPWLELRGATLVSTGNPAAGTYDVVVSATDDGLPAKTATHKFAINVRPAPVVKTKPTSKPVPFDHLKYTFLTRLVERGNRPEARIMVRTLEIDHTLLIGEEKDVAGTKIKLLEINFKRRTIEIELPGGVRRTVALGESLAGGPLNGERVAK